ncbi:hypothetical protein ABEB36_006310 [Hypothenemus hampei]|uniref:CUB domain-containing protein n=1 Tax=Hypothenemus hampei TaxID=57062 RepID=A0ABD1EQ46_HYPHA
MIIYSVLTVLLVLKFQNVICGYIEKVTVSGCESCQLMLTCRRLDTTIAIFDVDFRARHPVYDSTLLEKMAIFPPDHPRDALNKRCSGLNHCSFVLSADSPGGEAWGLGNITVKYACVTRDKVHPYCNTDIQLSLNDSRGFLQNPGYPRFYAGQLVCTWKIRAPSEKKIFLKFLDVALFDSRERCNDILEVTDSGQIIFSTCAQAHPPSELISPTNSLEIRLKARQKISPRRGVLIYYKLIGCFPADAPTGAILVAHNDSMATYRCSERLVFPDTQATFKTIECIGDTWNVSVPLLGCEKPESLFETRIKLQEILKFNEPMASDLVAPILLIIILFALNGIVLFYIHRARKKHVVEIEDEELGTFTENKQRKEALTEE